MTDCLTWPCPQGTRNINDHRSSALLPWETELQRDQSESLGQADLRVGEDGFKHSRDSEGFHHCRTWGRRRQRREEEGRFRAWCPWTEWAKEGTQRTLAAEVE